MMALYMDSYDQHRDRDYTPIWTQLRAWGAKRILESVWFVNINANAGAIRDALKRVTRSEDSLAVVELQPGSWWATQGAQNDGVTWLQQNVKA